MFKQYSGSQARFDTEDGRQTVSCFTHHISEFTDAATKAGLQLKLSMEFFDEDDSGGIPRILALLFIR